MKMKNFAVCYNQEISHSVEIKDKLVKILLAKGLSVDVLDIDGLKEGFDFVFVIGGDGTILKTARFYAKYKVYNYTILSFFHRCKKYILHSA